MRALLVTAFSPFATDFGARQRTHLMLRALEEIGQVEVLLLQAGGNTAVKPPADGRLVAEATFRSLPLGIRKYSPDGRLNRLLVSRVDLGAYDVICGRYLEPVSKLDLPERVPSIVDLDDVGYAYAPDGFASRIAAAGKTAVRSRLERAAVRRFSRYWFVCERDRGRFPNLAGGVLPNVPVGPVPVCDVESSGSTLLFVGALWYGPNRAGIERFLAACWPQIRKAEPRARLLLAGAAPQADRDRWGRLDGVRAPGFVQDLDGAYAEAAFTIAPIYSGGGSNIKVLESLAKGRACVTTTYCLDALRPHFNGTTDIVAAAGDAQMVGACLRLLREPGLREMLASNGRSIVAERFSYDRFRRAVHEEVRLAIDRRP